jgi:hypothetical protein
MNLEQIRWWRAQEARTDFEIALCDAALQAEALQRALTAEEGESHRLAKQAEAMREAIQRAARKIEVRIIGGEGRGLGDILAILEDAIKEQSLNPKNEEGKS